jgi:transposase
MIQVSAGTRILVAVKPADFRKGIDGIARLCREVLQSDPFSGSIFVFRNGRGTAIKLLFYDGQGFWLAHKRLSKGKFPCWPSDGGRSATALQAHQLQVLVFAGDPYATRAAPMWRPVSAAR